jgi:putative protease
MCLRLRDRYGKELPVKNYCSICANVIYNAVPTVLFDEPGSKLWQQIRRIGPRVLRMDLTVESPKEALRILAAYECRVLGRGMDASEFPFTRGHFKHGVE